MEPDEMEPNKVEIEDVNMQQMEPAKEESQKTEPAENEIELPEMLINEEYKIWKKNAPYLYDLLVTHAFEWPAISVQWLPDVLLNDDKDYNIHRLVTGTNTSQQDHNYIHILSVQLPNDKAEIDAMKFNQETNEAGGYGEGEAKVAVVQKICHQGEVNRARYMPQNPSIIASKVVSGEVHVFDCTRHPMVPASYDVSPELHLTGQTKEGYGLSWNKTKQGHLISSSEDSTVCLWDVEQGSKTNRFLEALGTFRAHKGAITDSEWHLFHEAVFGSVGEDRMIAIWDTREDRSLPSLKKSEAHEAQINSIAFNYGNDYFIATASSDTTAAVWDLRQMNMPFHVLRKHSDELLQVEWSPHVETALATCGYDRRVCVWDLAEFEKEQTEEEKEDGPPELLFMHGGHTNNVIDLGWNLNEPWVLATVSEDNVMQIWQMEEGIYATG